jgi:hypothetical protein
MAPVRPAADGTADSRRSKGRIKAEGSQGEEPRLPPLRHELRHDGQQAAARPPQRRPLPLRQGNSLLRRGCYYVSLRSTKHYMYINVLLRLTDCCSSDSAMASCTQPVAAT